MTRSRRAILILIALLTMAPAASPVHAGDITVDGACSLAAAINAANTDRAFGGCPAGDGADVISLGGDVELESLPSHIFTKITIEGNGHTIVGKGILRIFRVFEAELVLRDVTLTNASDYTGAAVLNDRGTLNVHGSRITGNSAAESGGAIANNGGAVLISGSEISDNHSSAGGGAIYSRGGSLSIINSSIERNWSREGGGAILLDGPVVVTLFTNTVSDNLVKGSSSKGGAILSLGGAINIVDSQFKRNSANKGMAVYAQDSSVQIMGGSSFEDHETDGYGTVFTQRGHLNVSDSAFRNNHAGGWGGALVSLGGKLSVDKSEFSGNYGGTGGAIYIADSGELTVSDSDFAENASYIGGAIATESADLRIKDSRFDDNEGAVAGGAVSSDNGDMTVSGSSFSQNASDLGGAIRFDDGKLMVYDSSFSHNAGDLGGALSIRQRSALISFSEFSHNSSSSGGAILLDGGSLSIDHSKLRQNSTSSVAGAIWAQSGSLTIGQSSISDNVGTLAGAISINRVSLKIRNSTLSGNRAREFGGGALDLRGSGRATLSHVTIVNNRGTEGGGILHFAGAIVYLHNSVIAGSVDGSDCSGRLTVVIGSLIEDGSCLANLSGDPMLADRVVAEHRSSAYHPPLPGSPLIDAADDAYCTGADQIGARRPQSGACDIGAIESR